MVFVRRCGLSINSSRVTTNVGNRAFGFHLELEWLSIYANMPATVMRCYHSVTLYIWCPRSFCLPIFYRDFDFCRLTDADVASLPACFVAFGKTNIVTLWVPPTAIYCLGNAKCALHNTQW